MYYDGSVHIEEDDQCYSCEYFLKGVQCPLLEALALGVVSLDGDVQVKNCGFYKKFVRSLYLVDPKKGPDNPNPPEEERKAST
jgi:hypothetical protein